MLKYLYVCLCLQLSTYIFTGVYKIITRFSKDFLTEMLL